MLYLFKAEDRFWYEFLESLEIIPYLKSFLNQNETLIRDSFEKLLDQMRQKESSEISTRFIKEMNFDQFASVVEFTFEVIFAKNLSVIFKPDYDHFVSLLSVHSLAEKMSIDAQNASYIENLNQILDICCKSILFSYSKQY